jgi:hypothetical protein
MSRGLHFIRLRHQQRQVRIDFRRGRLRVQSHSFLIQSDSLRDQQHAPAECAAHLKLDRRPEPKCGSGVYADLGSIPGR